MSSNPSIDLPILDSATPETVGRLPRWLKKEVPKGNANNFTANLLEELKLETVCDNAKCPNRMECYSQKTATFMILGNVCTRSCTFCAVATGRPPEYDEAEPQRVAEAIATMGVKHAVLTSVNRDELKDRGAEIWYQTVKLVKELSPKTTI